MCDETQLNKLICFQITDGGYSNQTSRGHIRGWCCNQPRLGGKSDLPHGIEDQQWELALRRGDASRGSSYSAPERKRWEYRVVYTDSAARLVRIFLMLISSLQVLIII